MKEQTKLPQIRPLLLVREESSEIQINHRH